MSTMKCLKKSSFEMYEKFSPKNFFKITKVVKPILKLMSKKNRTNAVTPSTCNYDVVESFQNDINESELFQLKFKFFDECDEEQENMKNEELENMENEELERRLLEELAAHNEKFQLVKGVQCERTWALDSDVDIWTREDEFVTCGQSAEQQVAVPVY